MEFLQLLQVDRSLVAPEAQETLLVADRVWHEEGCPQEVRARRLSREVSAALPGLGHLVCTGAVAAQESSGARHLSHTHCGQTRCRSRRQG